MSPDGHPPSPSVLIIGAGELGTAVLQALAHHPLRRHHQADNSNGKINVLLRASGINSPPPDKQRQIAEIQSLGAGLETGDIVHTPVSDLASIFSQYDVVIQCAGYGFPPGTQLRVAQATVEARVQRFIPFQFGMDYDAMGAGNSEGLFDEMIEVRNLLRENEENEAGKFACGWTIISTGLFVSYLFLPGFGIVDFTSERRKVRALASWDNSITVSTLGGIGSMVAEVVYAPRFIANQVIYIGGETITYGGLADLLEGVYGVEFERELWDMAKLRSLLGERPGDLFARYRVVFGAGVGVAWDLEKTLNRQRGIRLDGVEDFVRKNKDALWKQQE